MNITLFFYSVKNPLQEEEPLVAKTKTTGAFLFEVRLFWSGKG